MQHLIQLNEDTYVDAEEVTSIIRHTVKQGDDPDVYYYEAILDRLELCYGIDNDKLQTVLDALVYKPANTWTWKAPRAVSPGYEYDQPL